MIDIPQSTKDLILGGLLYFTNIRQQYIALMEGKYKTLVDQAADSPFATVERTIQLFIRADINTSHNIIIMRLLEDVKRVPPARKQYIEDLLNLIDRLSNRDNFTEQLCERQLQEVNKAVSVISITNELKKMHSVPQLKELLDKASSQLSRAERPNRLIFHDPIAAARDLLKHRDKTPTGISFIDTLTGGGITWGEHGGCLGAPSGGKSLLANMLACNIAIQGFNTMILQFEQSVANNSDILSRIYSYLTHLPAAEFRNKDYSELSEEAKTALDKCIKISQRIRVASFIDNDVERSVRAIIESIDQSCKDGFIPKLVIIDWLGAVVSEFLASAAGGDQSYPILAQEIQDKLNNYGKEKNISFFYLHQLSNDAAAKESGVKPSMYDSYFFKGFSQKLEYCLQLGTKNNLGNGKFALWIGAGKIRDAEPDKWQILVMNGQYARLESTKEGEYVINRKGQIVAAESLTRVQGDDDSIDYSPNAVDSFADNFR